MTRTVVLAGAVLFLSACAAPSSPPEVAVAPGQYPAAFDAARETLLGYRFELQRIDARAGVMTTSPKRTGGFATPWDLEQSSLGQDWEDLINDQQRTVRISFGAPGPVPPDADLRELTTPLTVHVEAQVHRTHRPGTRLEPTAVQLSTAAQDPELEGRGLWPTYTVTLAPDPDFARRVAAEIRRRIGAPTP